MTAKRAAQGSGTIRKKTVTRNGKTYTYWEARVTTGHDPATGRQVQRSFSGQTQKEVLEKMQAASVELNQGTYTPPDKMTMGEWLDIWVNEYLEGVKPRTKNSYETIVRSRLKPAFGAVKLQALTPHQIQIFYNRLQKEGLSPKSIQNYHGVLHRALQQALELDYIRANPADRCKLPRVERADIKPLNREQSQRFITAIKGHRYENIYLVAMFTGMREGEVLGLSWDCIDFKAGTILIKQQLQKSRTGNRDYHLASPKNGKSRKITPAASVMAILRKVRATQSEYRLRAGAAWDNPMNLVFTNEVGTNFAPSTVVHNFKRIVAGIGCPDTRFHDLRHTYAVTALQNGDDIKTVQETLGHHTAAFTLDVYGHVTEEMKTASAERMEAYIKGFAEL